MDISKHLIICIILTILLFPSYSYSSFLVFLLGLLIDIDHYLWYSIKYKDFNPKSTYFFHKKRLKLKTVDRLHIFHTSEFWLIILILSLNYYIFPLVIGLVFHLIMDFSEMPLNSKNLRSTSFIFWIYKNSFRNL